VAALDDTAGAVDDAAVGDDQVLGPGGCGGGDQQRDDGEGSVHASPSKRL
jgi:hypothetical protein